MLKNPARALIVAFLGWTLTLSGCGFLKDDSKNPPKQETKSSTNSSSTTPSSPVSAPTPPPPLQPPPPPPLASDTSTLPNLPAPADANVPFSDPGFNLPEAGSNLSISAGAEKKVAEGAYFAIEDAQAISPLGKSLIYQWNVTEGPLEKIQIVQGNILQGTFKILDLTESTHFTLKLSVSDGSYQASSSLKVTAFPARLELKNHLGGITRQVEKAGNAIYVSRGRTIEVYDPGWNLIAKMDLDHPILELVGLATPEKNYLYVISEMGEWIALDATDPKNLTQQNLSLSEIPGKNLRLGGTGNERWATTLTRDSVQLWSLSNPLQFQLRGNFKGPQSPLQSILIGKYLFRADANTLDTFDISTNVLLASIPAGGWITGLEAIERDGKTALIISLGESPEEIKKGDSGLRVFELSTGGRLINERRFHLKSDPSIQKLFAQSQDFRILLGTKAGKNLSLRLFDLQTETEIPLDLPADLNLIALTDFLSLPPEREVLPESGKAKKMISPAEPGLTIGLADTSTLRVLKLGPVGGGRHFRAESFKTSYSTLAPAAVKMAPSGNSLFLLDLGSKQNPLVPALLEIGAFDLEPKGSLVLGNTSYLSDFALTTNPRFHFATLLNEKGPPSDPEPHPETQNSSKVSEPFSVLSAESESASSSYFPREGGLFHFSTEAKPYKGNLSSSVFGGFKDPNESRALGLDAYVDTTTLLIAVAVGKTKGVGVGSGVVLLKTAPEIDMASLLKSDLPQKLTLIPLTDARDVKITSNGKRALVAAGAEGVVLLDLEKNHVLSRIPANPNWIADRILLSNDQKKVIVSYLSSTPLLSPTATSVDSYTPASINIYALQDRQLGFWGEISGLSSVQLPYGPRTGSGALSSDDLYLFIPSGKLGVLVYNISDPTAPILITQLSTHGDTVGVAVGQKYRNIYIADLINGLEMAEFGF